MSLMTLNKEAWSGPTANQTILEIIRDHRIRTPKEKEG